MTEAAPRPARRAAGRVAPLPAAERRDQIIARVLPLLVERGAAATSRELARAAGVAEGTIWKVFADKDDLLTSAIAHAVDPVPVERAVAAIDPSLPLEQRLVVAAEILQRRLVGIWSLLSKIGPVGLAREERRFADSPATIALFAAARDRVRVSPAEAAQRFRALVLAFSHPVLNDPPPSAAELVELFLHGVGAHP